MMSIYKYILIIYDASNFFGSIDIQNKAYNNNCIKLIINNCIL